MYSFNQIEEAIDDPHRILRECNRLYHTRFNTREYNPKGIDIFDEDWDNLIILDACRYDIFKKHSNLSGDLEHRISRSASTQEFIRANFTNKTLHDTVYISGNSHYFKMRDRIGASLFGEFDFANLQNKSEVFNIDQYERNLRMKPKLITEFAKQCIEKFPNKRLLIHFIPPHHPFQGPTAEEVFGSVEVEKQPSRLFELIRRGEVDIRDETLRTMYVEELNRVLPYVDELLEVLPGKTVISADHGELLGDRCTPIPHKGYGHHAGLYVNKLVKVPWFISKIGSRKEIVSESPSEENRDRPTESSIDENLQALGYKT